VKEGREGGTEPQLDELWVYTSTPDDRTPQGEKREGPGTDGHRLVLIQQTRSRPWS